MPALFVASAVVPAVCEESIRSSYIFYLGDRGTRRLAVVSIGAVFVIGEIAYDLSLLPSAIAEFGYGTAIPLFMLAIISGVVLHSGLTYWTARRQSNGEGVWLIFALAMMGHAVFNLAAISLMERLL